MPNKWRPQGTAVAKVVWPAHSPASVTSITQSTSDPLEILTTCPQFSDALTKVMNDLISKEEMLATFGQKADIYGNLTLLQETYEVGLLTSVTLQLRSMYWSRPHRPTPPLYRTSPWTKPTKKTSTTQWVGHLGRSGVPSVRTLDGQNRQLRQCTRSRYRNWTSSFKCITFWSNHYTVFCTFTR